MRQLTVPDDVMVYRNDELVTAYIANPHPMTLPQAMGFVCAVLVYINNNHHTKCRKGGKIVSLVAHKGSLNCIVTADIVTVHGTSVDITTNDISTNDISTNIIVQRNFPAIIEDLIEFLIQ